MLTNITVLSLTRMCLLSTVIRKTIIHRNYSFPFITRREWRARPPLKVEHLKSPVPMVVIHHTSTVPKCYDWESCSADMRDIQDYHGWWDIGYHFAVGSNAVVYEGRGWSVVGAQALHYNYVSIGITFIGNCTLEVPPQQQILTVKELINTGVKLGYVQPGYILVGHRDVRDTKCPGDALYKEIHTWSHFRTSASGLETKKHG